MADVTDQMKHRNTRSSPAPPRRIYLYAFFVIRAYIDITQVIDHTAEDCFLYHHLECEKVVPESRELFQTCVVAIRYLRKEETYGNKYTRQNKLEIFKNSIRERLHFINSIAKI